MYHTRQEIYDIVRTHLLSMKSRCVDPETGSCVYRNPKGAKCAVGALIPDHLYDPLLEGNSVGCFSVDTLMSFGINPKDLVFLSALQMIHDSGLYWEEGFGMTNVGIAQLDILAKHYGLEIRTVASEHSQR